MTAAAACVNLILTECFDWLPWLAKRILHAAALHLPPKYRQRYEDEWLGELDSIPGLRVSRLAFSLRVFFSATATMRAISPETRLYFSTPAKRLVDFSFACLVLVLLMPMFLVIGLAIKLTSAGPIFIKERHLGFEGETFDVIGFSTTASVVGSANLTSRPSNLRPVRVTTIGRLLRKLSLDELPQFINVMKGDMSLVGPRPLLAKEAAYLKDWHNARHAVRPGITGLWQVRWDEGRSFDDMVRLDLRYMQDSSAGRDIRIMLGTVRAALRSRPI